MPEQRIDYGRLVEQALRQVVRDALSFVAEHGLPGRHHIYITFRSDHPDVELEDSLRARYPTEMTIVLQYEFWGLEVGDDRFSVTLSFGGAPQRLTVPFEAVTVFADPSVEFGLQFTTDKAQSPVHVVEPVEDAAQRERPKRRTPATVTELPKPAAPAEDDEKGGEVVALDRFRKK